MLLNLSQNTKGTLRGAIQLLSPKLNPHRRADRAVLYRGRFLQQNTRETKCAECGRELFDGNLLRMEDNRPLCLDCADLGHLEFLASGNTALLLREPVSLHVGATLGGARIVFADVLDPSAVDAVLLDVDREHARRVRAELAAAPGRIVPVILPNAEGRYDWARLIVERTVTVNTAAAGGNAALLSLAEDAV